MKKIFLTLLLILILYSVVHSQTHQYYYNARYRGWFRTDQRLGIGINPTNLIDAYSGANWRFSLYANGNMRIGTSAYLNWGATAGNGGYGIRDNAGIIQIKNDGGVWQDPYCSGALTGVTTLDMSGQFTSTLPNGTAPFNLTSATLNPNLNANYLQGEQASAFQDVSPALTSISGLAETNGGMLYGTGDNAYAWLAAGTEGTLLMGNGAAAPSWLGAGMAGYFLLGNDAADPIWTSQPTLTSLEGLGLTAGDLLYATGADALNNLTDVAVGQVLVSGGIGVAPSWNESLTLSGKLVVDDSARVEEILLVKGKVTANSDIQVTDQIDITDGTDIYTLKVSGDQLLIQNDAGTPATVFDIDGSGIANLYATTTAQLALKNSGDNNTIFNFHADRAAIDNSIGDFNAYWGASNRVAQMSFMSGSDAVNKDDGYIVFKTSNSGSSVSERMKIGQAGNVRVGATTAFNSVYGYGTPLLFVDSPGLGIAAFRADAYSTGLVFMKSRTTTGALGTVVQDGDQLGQIHFSGDDGDEFVRGSSIETYVDGTPSDKGMPSRLVFSVSGVSDASPDPVLYIYSDEKVQIDGTSGNQAHPHLTLLNDDEQATTETGQTVDLIFEVKGTSNGGTSFTNQEAGKISCYKIGDYFHVSDETDNDAGLKLYTVTDGSYVLNSTWSDNDLTVVGDITSANVNITSGGNILHARKFTIAHTDLTDNDTSEDELLFQIPAGGMVQDCYAYVTTQFTGGTVSACTMALGDTDPDGLGEEHDVLGCGNTTWILELQDGTDKGDYLFNDANNYRMNKIYATATNLNAQFVTTDGDCADLTAGSVDIYIIYLVAN